MDLKQLGTHLGTVVITAAVMGVLGSMLGVFEAGTEALDKAQIRAVIEEVMVRENGDTYGSSLVSIDGTLIAINTNITAIQKDIDKLERTLGALAGE